MNQVPPEDEATLRRLILNTNASTILSGHLASGAIDELAEKDINRAVQQAQAVDCAVRSRLRWEDRRADERSEGGHGKQGRRKGTR